MKHLNLYVMMIVVVLSGLMMLTSSAHAAPQATYTLVQSSVNPGGSGGAGIYTIASSIGQPDAGEVSAGIYTLGGGVIVAATGNYDLFLPLMLGQ